MGTYEGLEEESFMTRLLGSDLGLSVVVAFKAKLYPFEKLEEKQVVNDQFNGKDLLVVYSTNAKSATAWERQVEGKILTFELADKKDSLGGTLLRDNETQSYWSWLTGEAVEGPLKGKHLKQVAYNPILNDRFHAFYPGAPEY